MKAAWQGRLTQTAARYAEHAPATATCCNACRACAQTNAIAAGLALVVAAGDGVTRLMRRTARRG